MCAMFVAPFAELVLDASVATAGAGYLSNQFIHFEEPIKKLAIDEIGKLSGEYAKNHPGGAIDNIINTANLHRKKKRVRTNSR
jgi:hypothetical protein